jgi:DNA-binding beta-propeller fold protein YncE
VYVNITPDDKLLFVSEEALAVITVIDFQRARASGFKGDAVIGDVPVGGAPIALTFSSDGKWLYTTSESASPHWKWPKACKPEGLPRTPEQFAALKAGAERQIAALQDQLAGALEKGAAQLQQQIDSLRALTNDPSGDQLVNPEGAVVVVDVGRARTDPANAVTARIPAECSAVRALGTIPAGAFPRELSVSADGHTLFLTNAGSSSLQVIDIDRLPVEPPGKP